MNIENVHVRYVARNSIEGNTAYEESEKSNFKKYNQLKPVLGELGNISGSFLTSKRKRSSFVIDDF